MELHKNEVSANNPGIALKIQQNASTPLPMGEVEQLLSGRTRDIRLKGGLLRLFQERSWHRTAKIIRSWMIWVTFIDLLTLGLNAIVALPLIPRFFALRVDRRHFLPINTRRQSASLDSI